MRRIHATCHTSPANPTQYREIIINSHNVTTKLAHHDVSAGANNVSHYLLISPITSHNILCPLSDHGSVSQLAFPAVCLY